MLAALQQHRFVYNKNEAYSRYCFILFFVFLLFSPTFFSRELPVSVRNHFSSSGHDFPPFFKNMCMSIYICARQALLNHHM